jgi:predicted AAA+ superfamily ATPase
VSTRSIGAFKESPIVALLDACQVGKTTLAQLYGEKFDRRAWHYFDLEDPRDQARLSQPQMALEDLGGLIVLDEMQRVPDRFPTPGVLADDPNTKNRYILSGSASSELMHQISESLASRIALVDVSGFHQRELTYDCMKDLWWRGGFPKVFLVSSDSVARRWHLDYFLNFPRTGYSSAWIVDTFGSK